MVAAVRQRVSPQNESDLTALVGWQAKQRQVDLTIERGLKGPELLARMKGWVTSDVTLVEQVLSSRGRIKLLDDRELVIECENEPDFKALEEEIGRAFGDQVSLEKLN